MLLYFAREPKKIMIFFLQLLFNDTAAKLNLTKIRGPPGPMVSKAPHSFPLKSFLDAAYLTWIV